jgi:hypothetical protein
MLIIYMRCPNVNPIQCEITANIVRTPTTTISIHRSSLCSLCIQVAPPGLYSTRSPRNTACAGVQVRMPHMALREGQVCYTTKSVGGAKLNASRMLVGFDAG